MTAILLSQVQAFRAPPCRHFACPFPWYDPRGMQVKAADANGLFAKTAYDGLGRVIASYSGFDDGESSYADAIGRLALSYQLTAVWM